MVEQGFWDNRTHSEKLSKELQHKKQLLVNFETLNNDYDDLKELFDLMQSDANSGLNENELTQSVERLSKEVQKLRAFLFLDGKYDACDVIMTLHAGTGGKDAQDFAQMLLRMYLRYFDNAGYKYTIIDSSDGEEVGLKSATLEVFGHMAYGMLKSEHGVHRLVRLSPFNAKNTRETSFALVEILPIIDDADTQIDPKDLRIDTFRASGKGGQGVNTTDSAVRITHIPTNTVVQCQNERSQMQNKEAAMRVLVSKLLELKEQQKVEDIHHLKGGRKEISWGNQIRSYVLQPYTLVKDNRTKAETANVQKVLDGDIDMFIEAYLVR